MKLNSGAVINSVSFSLSARTQLSGGRADQTGIHKMCIRDRYCSVLF